MASITQTIPNFFGGISEVPDSQKGQGQVNDALNCVPDLNKGLYKRPGTRRVGTAPLSGATSDGSWFHYYRDRNEGSYIGQVQTNGSVNVWDADSGVAITVSYGDSSQSTAISNYLSFPSGTPQRLQFTTINDNTFVCNRGKPVYRDSTQEPQPHVDGNTTYNYRAFVELKKLEAGRQYALDIHNPSISTIPSISTATQLSVAPTGEGFTTYTGEQGHCPKIGTKVFTKNGSFGARSVSNLIFRITTTGQQGPEPGTGDTENSDDFTCSYSTTIDLLHGGEGWAVGDSFDVVMEGHVYPVTVDAIETSNVAANIKAIRPTPLGFDRTSTPSATAILGAIQGEFSSLTNINTEIIGNGIYIYSTSQFTVTTSETDLMTIITDRVNDVTGLPFQCRDGYVVKVENSSATEDDYWLKFEGQQYTSGNTTVSANGVGTWVECLQPGLLHTIDPSSTPITITRKQDSNSNLYFELNQFPLNKRVVGDYNTNPFPSFVSKYNDDGTVSQSRYISKVFFFRNRLGFLSGENVVLSRPGDLGNFFNQTALTVSGTDPIDISGSSQYPGSFIDAIETNTGLLVFAEMQQFLLATDSDILNPDSAKLSNISTYKYNIDIPPFSLGTTTGFVDNSGINARFMVMSNVAREGEPNVLELSKVVSRKLPRDLNLIAVSRENTTVFFGKSDSNEVFGYKYFNVADKQLQSSWFRWEFRDPIKYHCIVKDDYIVVDDKLFLQKLDLLPGFGVPKIREGDGRYGVHLDNYIVHDGTYDSVTRKTTFNLSWLSNIDRTKTLTAVNVGTGGVMHQEFTVPSSGTTVQLNGDWTAGDAVGPDTAFGYSYTMSVELPRFHVQRVSGEKTVNEERGSLVIHRVKPSFGRLGQYQSVVSRVGKVDFTRDIYSSSYNQYIFGDVLVEDEFQGVVPVYEKNTNFTFTIKSTSPLPATLISLTWEGDYSPKYYKNV